MRTRASVALTAACLAALAGLTACGSTDTSSTADDKPAAARDAADKPKTDTGTETADSADTADSETATLPDMTGKDLQAAQDAAQEAGFYVLTSSDATGQGRMQVLDRNWTVCSQTPAAGDHPTDTTVNFDAVKTGESC